MTGTWLLTGGAGYIGAHVVRALLGAGHRVVVVDDLSTGDPQRLPDGVPLEVLSVLDTAALTRAMQRHHVDAIIHLAAKKSVGESVLRPDLYHRQNVTGTASLLAAAGAAGVDRLLLSSTAAVYGECTPMKPGLEAAPVAETAPLRPVNPYGWTKLLSERLVARAGTELGLRWIALRYFNVAGAAAPHLADTGGDNLIPRVLAALRGGRPVQLFGDDYPTPDGSCIRDYIHVSDVASAHVAAATRLLTAPASDPAVDRAYNIGTGVGVSVLDIMAVAAEVTGLSVTPVHAARRAGDPPSVVADVSEIRARLGWRSERDVRSMLRDTWAAQPVLRLPGGLVRAPA